MKGISLSILPRTTINIIQHIIPMFFDKIGLIWLVTAVCSTLPLYILQIEIHYKPILNEPAQTFSWTDPNSNSSYLLCDQQWHNLQIKKNGNLVSITADSYVTNVQTSQSGSISGNLYIGGIPGRCHKTFYLVSLFPSALQLENPRFNWQILCSLAIKMIKISLKFNQMHCNALNRNKVKI